MTPPPAATIAGTARSRAAARPTTPHRGWTALRRPGGALRSLPRPVVGRPSLSAVRAAVVERLFGGRAWIAVLGTMLLGLVFLQVSLLQLNTQISTDIGRAAKLERGNAEARSTISHLSAGRRVQDAARTLGMILPGAGALCYLSADRAHPCDGGKQSGSTAQAADGDVVAATPPAGSAAAAAQPAATTPVTTLSQQPATTAPAQASPATTVTPGAAPAVTPGAATTTTSPPPTSTTATQAPATAAPVTTGGQAAPR